MTARILKRDEHFQIVRDNVGEFEQKYGMTYATFSERMALDEVFYNEINRVNPIWEQDALEWEFWCEVLQDWQGKSGARSSWL